jgi:hypothetical protein
MSEDREALMQKNEMIDFKKKILGGKIKEVKRLVKEHNIDVNTVLPNDKSCLRCAVHSGNLEMCQFFVDEGADINHQRFAGYEGHILREPCITNQEIISYFLSLEYLHISNEERSALEVLTYGTTSAFFLETQTEKCINIQFLDFIASFSAVIT